MQKITLVRRLQAAEKLITRLANSVSEMQAYLADTGTKVRISVANIFWRLLELPSLLKQKGTSNLSITPYLLLVLLRIAWYNIT